MNVLCGSAIKTKGGIGMARDISIRPNATSDGKGDVMQECSVPDLWSHVGHFSGKDLPHDWKVQRVFLPHDWKVQRVFLGFAA
jgi:hypothetical protein